MSVECEMFLGYTVKLVEKDVSSEDYEFFEDKLQEREPDFKSFEGKYSIFTHDDNKVKLVVDGMSGEYIRLIYIQKHKDMWGGEDDYGYEKLDCDNIPEEVYQELNEAYKKIYNEDLDRDKIEYSLWYHWS